MIDDIPISLPEKPICLADQFSQFMCATNMSFRTEQAHVHWLLQYIFFHNKQHPKDMEGLR